MTPTPTGIDKPATTPRNRQKPRMTGVDWLVFLIPCGQLFRFNLIGVLSASDLMLLAVFIYFALSGKINIVSPLARKFLLLGSLYLSSQIVTDVVRHTTFTDYARGWSNIGLTLVNFIAQYMLLYGRPRRISLYGLGLAISGVALVTFEPDDLQLGYSWKMGYGYFISLGVMFIASRKEMKGSRSVAIMVAIGLINMLMSARGLGGICLCAAAYVYMTSVLRKRVAVGAKMKTSLKVVMVASLLICMAGIYEAYTYATERGLLGDDARDKYEEEASGKYGILLGGRTELLATIPAIVDSPILGHGSWAKDPGYLIASQEALARLGYTGAFKVAADQLEEGVIPTHSFLFGAWVYGGVLGAVFWAWAWVMIVKALSRIYPPAAELLPALSFFSILLLWDIFFSPYGMDRRQQVPYYLLLIMTYYDFALRSASQVAKSRAKSLLKPAFASGS